MPKTTDKSSIFGVLATLIALLLIAAAALAYLEAGKEADSSGASLAALSQSMPALAERSLRGDPDAFAALDENLNRLSALRRAAGPDLPGAPRAWQRLESSAAGILAGRDDVEVLHAATGAAAASVTGILEASDELLDRAGAAAAVQELQQRAVAISRSLEGLAIGSDARGVMDSVVGDVGYLRNVVDALSGAETDLDVLPLDEADRAALLAPTSSRLAALESAVQRIGDRAEALDGLAIQLGELSGSAGEVGSAFTDPGAAASSPLDRYLPLLPIPLLGVAMLMLGGLVILHTRSTRFEKTAREHAEQNERNQQAILRLLDEMGSLADGDLTVEATVTEDITGTIADSFNYAIEELRKLVTTVNETAIMVDSAAKQAEGTAVNMAKAAETQAREINAATGSIVSMAQSIEEVSGNAERSSDVARHSVEVAHKGGAAVRRTIDGMNTIRETIQETAKRIKRLGESSQEIGDIVELINDIAEQTNILALNASIQASMAGEAGRGFAVVADEVQRLAERSTNATKQIEVLVRTIQSDTNEAVVSMERSTTDVVGGALLAENAGAALDEIEQVSNQIASLVQNITASARQQAKSAADVTKRTSRLKNISNQTGQATTATAAAIAKLSELASELRKSVAGFTLPTEALRSTPLGETKPRIVVEEVSAGRARAG